MSAQSWGTGVGSPETPSCWEEGWRREAAGQSKKQVRKKKKNPQAREKALSLMDLGEALSGEARRAGGGALPRGRVGAQPTTKRRRWGPENTPRT